MNTRPVLATVLATATITLAACSSSKTSASPTPSPTQWPRMSCSQAPTSTVGAALGVDLNPPQELHQDPVTVCTYVLKSKANAVVLRFQTGSDAKTFASGRSGYVGGTTDVPGFQDEAFSSVQASGSSTVNTVAARKGSVAIVVTSTASIAQEKALEQQLFATL
jgi:hypothetical protein